MAVASPLLFCAQTQRRPASRVSVEFRDAVVAAFERLSRRGVRPILPQTIWEDMQTAARMEGTLSHLLAWDDTPGKFGRNYTAVVAREIEQLHCGWLTLEPQADGTQHVDEYIPF